jgi:hypothetical protein
MLLRSAVLASIPLAQQLVEKGLSLAPGDNSLLAQLCGLSECRMDNSDFKRWSPDAMSDAGYGLVNDILSEVSDYGDTQSPHSVLNNDTIDLLVSNVRQHIKYAKNTVNVIRNELNEKLTMYLEHNPAAIASEDLQVISYDLPELLRNEFFLQSLKEFDNTPVQPVRFQSPRLGSAARETIEAILATHDSATDDLIAKWTSTVGIEYLWNSNFDTHYVDGTLLVDYPAFKTDAFSINVYADGMLKDSRDTSINTVSAALFLYLVANKFTQSPDTISEFPDMDGDALKFMSDLRFYAGAVLSRCIKSFNLYGKAGTVVLDAHSKYIVVYTPTYEDYLNEGGSVEAILGRLVSANKATTKELLLEANSRLLVEYSQFNRLNEMSYQNGLLSRFKDITAIYFHDMMQNPSEIERECISKSPNHLTEVQALADAYIRYLEIKDLSDPSNIALELIARCRFFFTDAYDILKDIDRITESDDNIEVRDSALLAVINYITDYFYDQVKVVNYGL